MKDNNATEPRKPQLTLSFTAMHNDQGQRLCTCGSGAPWNECGSTNYCG